MSNKAIVEVKLADEDRKLLESTAALMSKALAAVGGKSTKTPPKGKTASAKDDDAGDDFDDMGDGDDGDGDGDDGDGDDGDDENGPSIDDVGEALKAYAAATSKAQAVKLLKAKGGVDKLSELDDGKFEAVIKAAQAATKKAKAAKSK